MLEQAVATAALEVDDRCRKRIGPVADTAGAATVVTTASNATC